MHKRISENEIKALYTKFDTPAHVIRHCRAVTQVALSLAQELNKYGYNFELDLIKSAGLSHDAARIFDDHGGVCADELERLGYRDEASIVRCHMYHNIRTADKLTECDMVCLADKLVREDEYVGLIPRMNYLLDKIHHDTERECLIRARWKELAELIANIEKITGISVDSLFTDEEN